MSLCIDSRTDRKYDQVTECDVVVDRAPTQETRIQSRVTCCSLPQFPIFKPVLLHWGEKKNQFKAILSEIVWKQLKFTGKSFIMRNSQLLWP